VTILAFIDSVMGTIPADFAFFRYLTAGSVFVVFCAIVLNLFIGAISTLTNRFF
jgi:hypothetical protein